MTMSDIIGSRKVTRIIPLNSEEVARSQPSISELLSDNANKDNTRLCALSSPDAEKTSTLSPQVEKDPLLNESIFEAEGTAKMIRSVMKPNTNPVSPVKPQNPSNFSEDACKHGCKSLLSIGGDNLQFCPILPYFQHWGDEPRPPFFSSEQIK